MKRVLKYALLVVCFLALGFAYQYYIPKFEKFLLKQVVALGKKYAPVDFKVGRLKLHPLALGAALEDVEIQLRGDAKSITRDIKVQSIFGRLSLLSLIRGELRFGVLEIEQPQLAVFINLDPKKKKSEISIPLHNIFRIPINEVRINKLQMTGRIDPQATVFKIEDLDLILENRFKTLWVDFSAPTSLIKPSGPTPPIELQMEVRGAIEEKQIRLSALKLKRKDSYVISSGFFWGDVERGALISSDMATRAHVNLESLKDWVAAFAPGKKIPEVSGVVDMDFKSGFKKDRQYLNSQFSGENLIFDKYHIGNVDAEGAYADGKFSIAKATLQNSSGAIQAEQIHVHVNDTGTFSFKASPNVEIETFLSNIGIQVPVKMKVSGQAQCSGQYKEPMKMNCDGVDLKVANVLVHSGGKEKKTIVAFASATAKGSLEVDKQQVKYAANLTLGTQSKGQSQGTISYQDGFVIHYDSPAFHFSDVENLVNLKLEGSGSIKGETRGTSKNGTLDLVANLENFALDDFLLGTISSQVKYQGGLLHFKETNGIFNSTRYSGHVSLNLPDSEIYLYFKSPFLELSDVKEILSKRLPIPIALSGSGSAEFRGHGPLNIEKLNYDVSAKIFRGHLAQESFDSIDFVGNATEGVLKAQKAILRKGRGEVNLSGSLAPAWSTDLHIIGKDLRLEQSENLVALGLDLQGVSQVQMSIKGDIKNPRIKLDGQTQKLVVADQSVADSDFSLDFLDQGISGTASLFAGQVKTEFLIPKGPKDPFNFKLNAKRWDVSKIFEAIARTERAYDFETALSVNAQLESSSGGFWNSNGTITVEDFMIRRGSQALSSKAPMHLHFQNGVIQSENFNISGGEHFLRLNVRSGNRENLNAQLNGKIDMNLFGVFLPFASDVRGLLSLNTSLNGPINDLRVSGSAYLDKGYLKAKDFPHPFTELRADILFNQKTLMLNSFRGEVASGKISGDGSLRFENKDSVSIQIQANIDKVSLNFPENYKTKGSVRLNLTGNHMPYLVKLNYDVAEAEITSEFGGGSGTQGIRQSPYLPPTVVSATSSPFVLDLDLNFQNPVRVSNSLIQASLNGGLNIRGPASELIFKGELNIQPGGLVFFRDVPFEVSTGFIEYASTTADNPKIYLSASTRVGETVMDADRRQTENQYDVNMLVQGRGTDPQVTLTSQPPLPQKDIVSLLALGLTQEALDESKNTGLQMTSTSTAIGAALLQKPVGKKLKDRFGVDMKVSSSQASADAASSAKVTFSKQWSPKLTMSASGTLEANPQSSVKLEYQMRRGLSVIGSWEGKEQGANPNEERKDVTNSVLGLDLEYKVQFK